MGCVILFYSFIIIETITLTIETITVTTMATITMAIIETDLIETITMAITATTTNAHWMIEELTKK